MKTREKAFLAGMLLAAGLMGTGCGGVSASGSVSPATFFLPGLMSVEPEKAAPAEVEAPEPEVAATRSLPAGLAAMP